MSKEPSATVKSAPPRNGEAASSASGGTAKVEVGKMAMPTVNWDDSHMKTSYANVVNASSTREEVTLFFGSNQTWNVSDKQEFNVLLSDRIVLNPYAAKRLHMLLGAVLNEYEKRFGTLTIDRS